MKNDTTGPPMPWTEGKPDFWALLRSDDFAWEGVPETRSALSCGKTFIWGFNKRTGLDLGIPIETCGTWWHQSHAEKRVTEIFADIYRSVGITGSAYFAVVKTAEMKGNLMAGRRYRKQKKLGRPVWYRTIQRDNGTTFVMASDPLNGRDQPATLFDAVDPMSVAAAALTLPGVTRVDGSRRAAQDDELSDEDLLVFGASGQGFHRWVKRVAADIAFERYGVVVNPLAGAAADGAITSDEWASCLREAWDQLKKESQQRRQG